MSLVAVDFFAGNQVRSFYVEDKGQCIVASDVWRAAGYKRGAGVQAIQRYVPGKYKIRLGDAFVDLQEVLRYEYLHPDTILLTEPGLYTFLLRCGRSEAESFLEWVVEEVLPREMRRLAAIIEEHRQALEDRDGALALLGDDLEDRDRQLLALVDEVEDRDRQLLALEDDLDDRDRQLEAQAQENAGLRERHVPHRPPIDTLLCVFSKNDPHERGRSGRHSHYMTRCQRKQLTTRINALRVRYPEMTVREPECDDPNAVHAWCRFKEDVLTKDNFYRNHFTLPDDDTRELFEGMFDIDMA